MPSDLLILLFNKNKEKKASTLNFKSFKKKIEFFSFYFVQACRVIFIFERIQIEIKLSLNKKK